MDLCMQNTDTTALNTGTANFETQQWNQADSDTLVIKGTKGYYAFSAIFVVIGDALALVGFLKLLGLLGRTSDGGWLMILIGIIFLTVGLFTYRNCNQQTIISRQLGIVQVQQWLPANPSNVSNIVMEILPDDIHALQIVSHSVTQGRKNQRKRVFTQYQVNVVQKNGERNNLLISLKLDKAQTLSLAVATLFAVPSQLHSNS